jgi:truncated hemoglobin YjbI
MNETLNEKAGGETGLDFFMEVFYSRTLADPILQSRFGVGKPFPLSDIAPGPEIAFRRRSA